MTICHFENVSNLFNEIIKFKFVFIASVAMLYALQCLFPTFSFFS